MLATYILPALVLLVAAAVLYQFIPKPLRKPPDKPSSSQVSGTQSQKDGNGAAAATVRVAAVEVESGSGGPERRKW